MTRVAAWQYPIEQLASFDAWRAKLDTAVASVDAELLVMPEYASMELTSLLSADDQATLDRQLDAIQAFHAPYLETLANASRTHNITIVGGSFPERVDANEYRNRLRVFTPTHAPILVEKLQMTRFERERWGITGGSAQPVIELGPLRLGIAICYDSEFPLIVRRLVEAGANVIAVPSCTDGLAGYHRVRVACLARALENQCYVIQAPTVGLAPWSIAVDENVGAAGVFAPCDRGFPDDGIVAIGTLNASGIVTADIDLALVDSVRRDGQVLGNRDWGATPHLVGKVERVRVRGL